MDEDLLDLLSDDDTKDPTPKKRTKPRIQLKTIRPKLEGSAAVDALQQPQSDGKPITSRDAGPDMDSGREATASELDSVPDRPRTSHGRPSMRDVRISSEAENLMVATGAPKSTGGDSEPSILKLDSPMHQSAASRKPRGSVSMDFSDDDDDILSGMGLEDEAPPLRSSAGGLIHTSRERRGSKLDELLGTAPKKPAMTAKLGTESPKTEKTKAVGSSGLNTDSNGEEDGYQFGGYVPSVASGEAGKPTSLPSGRRRLSSDGDSLSLTSRPNSAPAKKSVRFADTVETGDRPSSSPSVSEGAKMPLKGSRKLSGSKKGESGLRKPPLPRKSETEREGRKPVEKSSGGGESTSDSTATIERDDSQSDLKPKGGEELISGDR